MADYQRAYSAEHKAERFADIMAATDGLFRTHGFHEVTLTTIAKELGWSRGNLYRYAQTKEEVFLALYRQKHRTFVDALVAEFDDALPLPADEFAARWAKIADAHHDYWRYQGILTSVIETNVSADLLADFKRELLADIAPAIALISAQMPRLSDAQAAEAHLALVYHAAALHGHLCGSPTQMKAMEQAGMPLPEGGFKGAMTSFARTYLAGLAAIHQDADSAS